MNGQRNKMMQCHLFWLGFSLILLKLNSCLPKFVWSPFWTITIRVYFLFWWPHWMWLRNSQVVWLLLIFAPWPSISTFLCTSPTLPLMWADEQGALKPSRQLWFILWVRVTFSLHLTYSWRAVASRGQWQETKNDCLRKHASAGQLARLTRHTYESLVLWRCLFTQRPRREPESATKSCQAPRAQHKLRTKSIAQ